MLLNAEISREAFPLEQRTFVTFKLQVTTFKLKDEGEELSHH